MKTVRPDPERGGLGLQTCVASPEEGVGQAADLLKSGGIVGLPTETVYGLAGCALKPEACAKIFEAKERPLSDPLIVHVPDTGWLAEIADVPAAARDLAAAFWPGPLTLILPRRSAVPDIVTSGQDTVAVRMSAHPVFQQVLAAFGGPVAAPSANRFGRISPTTAGHVLEELAGRIPLIVDGGPCTHGLESTIAFVRDDGIHILRSGPVTASDLSRFGAVRGGVAGISAPGNLASHYAPRTPLAIGRAVPEAGAGLLAWESDGAGFDRVEHLSRAGDLREAAANLYGAMRRLDAAGLRRIIAEPVPETGLGAAIMERLRKAAAR